MHPHLRGTVSFGINFLNKLLTHLQGLEGPCRITNSGAPLTTNKHALSKVLTTSLTPQTNIFI